MSPQLAVGAIFGATVIYGANFALTRDATLRGLTPYDLAALRFGVAGLILLPVFVRRGVATCAGIGWRRGTVLGIMSGAPMTLFMNTGLSLAPAAHGAALGPGTVTAMGVVYGAVAAGAWPPRTTVAGLLAIVSGLAAIALAGTVSGSRNVILGDLCFIATGLIWGGYPLLLHRWRVDGVTGATVVSVLSLSFLPVYLVATAPRFGNVSGAYLLFQAVFQGVLNGVAGLWLWGIAIRVLGVRTQLFPPLIPVLGTLFAIPVLGEVPGPAQFAGVLLIVAGIGTAVMGERAARRRADLTRA